MQELMRKNAPAIVFTLWALYALLLFTNLYFSIKERDEAIRKESIANYKNAQKR